MALGAAKSGVFLHAGLHSVAAYGLNLRPTLVHSVETMLIQLTHAFERERDTLAAADAERDNAAFEPVALHGME